MDREPDFAGRIRGKLDILLKLFATNIAEISEMIDAIEGIKGTYKQSLIETLKERDSLQKELDELKESMSIDNSNDKSKED